MHIYINRAYIVHLDSRGYSGIFMIMRTGAMINTLKKLRLVTNSSTEIEVVSTGKRFPKCTWFRYFRIA